MSFWKIAWRSIQQRGLASALTTLSMALGVMLVVAVLSIHGVIAESFRSNASLGYNMIVGAKGGKLQLTLNTVYYLSQPVENISYEYFLEFLPAEKRKQQFGDPGRIDLNRDGKFGGYTHLAIPLCLGDYYERFRVIGTTPEFFDQLRFGPTNDKQFEFAAGRNFRHDAFFEAVVGSVVAREAKVKLGDTINPSHGVPDGHTHEEGFKVVGILEPSGTPNDRAVFVNMEGFYLMDDHAKPVEDVPHDDHDHDHSHDHDHDVDHSHDHDHEGEHDHERAEAAAAETHAESSDHNRARENHSHDDHGHDHAHDHHDHAHLEPLPMNQREVTAILIRTINPLVTPGLENTINEGREAQAVLPVREIYNLFDAIVRPLQTILVGLTAVICIVSGISILVSIYNSMSDRRHEIAVMRALGAGRGTVMTIVLLESVMLSLGGGLLGGVTAHLMNQFASPLIEAQTGVAIGFFDFQLSELLVIPAIILLAIICGFFPAVSAYRTDVAKSLGK